jgi:hypothetical protein
VASNPAHDAILKGTFFPAYRMPPIATESAFEPANELDVLAKSSTGVDRARFGGGCAIVAHIAADKANLDALRKAPEHTMALLKERRAAVTGKIAVQAGPESRMRKAEYEN